MKSISSKMAPLDLPRSFLSFNAYHRLSPLFIYRKSDNTELDITHITYVRFLHQRTHTLREREREQAFYQKNRNGDFAQEFCLFIPVLIKYRHL